MKRIHLGLLLAVLAVGFYGFYVFSGQELSGKQELRKASVPEPIAESSKLDTTQAAVDALAMAVEPKNPAPPAGEAGGNRASYRDIDRLKAEKTPEAVDALLKYLDHPNSWVKAHALRALGVVGSPRALPRVVQLLGGKDEVIVIRGAYMAIGGIGPHMTMHAEKQLAVDGLKKSLEIYRTEMTQDSRSNVYQLMEAAGHITGYESGEFLISELSKFHEDPLAQYSIVKALGENKFKPSEPVLRQFKTDLLNEGAEPWGDKELYSDLLNAVDSSLAKISTSQGAE